MKTHPEIRNEQELEEALARPSAELVDMMRRLPGDVMLLGAGGKMGPSMARLARNAIREAGTEKRVLAVSRYSNPDARRAVEETGAEAIAADLTQPEEVTALPRVENVIYMLGRKFGETGSEGLTWIANVAAPHLVARHFAGSRFVVFSTGCVYPLASPRQGLPTEGTPPEPVGEYAYSCLGREQVFAHHGAESGSPVLLYRLNYAVDLRYGVLVDIARDVLEGRPVDLTVSWFNCIWQGDANNRALLCLERARVRATPLNITGPELLSTEETARRFGELLGRKVEFVGSDSGQAYLSDASRSTSWFGPPQVGADELIEMVAAYIQAGGKLHGKPTKFQVTDGKFTG